MPRHSVRYSLILAVIFISGLRAYCDTVPDSHIYPFRWIMEGEMSGGAILGANSYLRGDNPINKSAYGSFSGDLRGAFKFNPDSKTGNLYKDLYQGIGVKKQTFFSDLLGSPWSVYVFQGSPIKHFNDKIWLGYEWEFGVAFDWKYFKTNIAAVSTSATAHMAVRLRLNQKISDHWNLYYCLGLTHFSNGNTSFANIGVNNGIVSVGISYNFCKNDTNYRLNDDIQEDADRKKWFVDILGFGAWRKRVANVSETQQIWQGKYGVAGINGALMRKLNRWFAVGPSLDVQYDSSAGLEPYWVPGTTDVNIRHYHVPFGKHVSAGISARGEFSMPIFTINAGIGFDCICPVGNGRLYQILSLKTFITDFLYLNVGYRLSNFKDSQHLMLGAGFRI